MSREMVVRPQEGMNGRDDDAPNPKKKLPKLER